MIERGSRAGFLLEAALAVRIRCQIPSHNFDGDIASEGSVCRPVDVAHGPRAERARDDVISQGFADHDFGPEIRSIADCISHTTCVAAFSSTPSLKRKASLESVLAPIC